MFATQFQLLVDSNVLCVTHSMCERKTTDRNEITRKHAYTYIDTHGTDIHSHIIVGILVLSTMRDCAFHSNNFFFLMFSMVRHLCFFYFSFSSSSFFWLFLILVALDVRVFEHRTFFKYNFLVLPAARALLFEYFKLIET